jgi:hypothetical protein
MAEKFLDILRENNLKIFPTERISLDYREREEYQDRDDKFRESIIFETDNSGKIRCIKDKPYSGITLFKYFLDGSRKVYRISEMLHNHKYLPLVCAQIGVACTKREEKIIQKYYLEKRNLFLVPDCMNENSIENIQKDMEDKTVHYVTINELIKYEYSRKENRKPLDLAIAKVNVRMQELEVKFVSNMTKANTLATDAMLIIDGSLQISDPRVNEENFRNVIGISKSFNVHLTELLKVKRREIGTLLVELKYGQRTPVYCREHGKIIIGAWYLRIRDEKRMKNPLEGIIKIEKIANQRENEHINGLDSEEVDNISRCLLSERNVTCYGKDDRWANHLYPIYLTEQLIKNSFISDKYYLNVF